MTVDPPLVVVSGELWPLAAEDLSAIEQTRKAGKLEVSLVNSGEGQLAEGSPWGEGCVDSLAPENDWPYVCKDRRSWVYVVECRSLCSLPQ